MIFIIPVTGWVSRGLEDDRLAAIGAEQFRTRERQRGDRQRKLKKPQRKEEEY